MSWALSGVVRCVSVRVQTMRICRSMCQKRHDLFESEAFQRHVQRVTEEHRCISGQLERGQLSETDRSHLKHQILPISKVLNAVENLHDSVGELTELQILIQNTGSEEQQMLVLLQEERDVISRRIQQQKLQLMEALVPPDPLDDMDVVLELVAGRTTGGDVSQQFCKELYHMYHHLAAHMGWSFQQLNYSSSEYGGLHHAAAKISGDRVHRWLRLEGGTHRVQRIPEVGLSSRMQRIHTGTVTVIVLPLLDHVDIHLAPEDLRIDTFRSRGPGGQSVNTTDSAVRVVHRPTGASAECQQFRSQHKNRHEALRVLRTRLNQNHTQQRRQESLQNRKQQMGTRSQSERIRTYNFSQSRVTDHRISYETRHIQEFMRGEEHLEELLRLLQEERDRETLLKLLQDRD